MKNTKSRFGMVMLIVGVALLASSNTSVGIALLAVGVVFLLSGIFYANKDDKDE